MNGGVQKSVRHSQSSSLGKLPHINNPEDVKESTEIIFKFLLKDCLVENERAILQNSPEIEGDSPLSLKSQDSFGLDLDLPTDIQSDSIPSKEDEEKANILKVAQRLGEIGDDIDRLYQGKKDLEESLITCAQQATTESVYQAFEKSLDNFLEDQRKYLPDSSEQYQVALVFLCTKKALTLANQPLTAASNNAEVVISNAVNFVSNRFPRWLGGIQ